MVADAGWVGLEFVSRGVYLGILFGPMVTTEDVCREVWDKFFARAARYREVLDSSSILDRVLVANTFLLPLWYYVASVIVLPYTMVAQVRRYCHTNIVPYHGGGFGYAHLITPRCPGEFSLSHPLKDLWAFNYALLSWSFPMEDSDLLPTPQMGVLSRVAGWDFLDRSLSPTDHAAYAAFYFLEDSAPRRHGSTWKTFLPNLSPGQKGVDLSEPGPQVPRLRGSTVGSKQDDLTPMEGGEGPLRVG